MRATQAVSETTLRLVVRSLPFITSSRIASSPWHTPRA
jgi:hypothetical protein